MIRVGLGVSLAVVAVVVCAHAQEAAPAAPIAFIRSTLGLSGGDVRDIERGEDVVKTLSPVNRREVITAGAIRIQASPRAFITRFRTLEGFKTSEFVKQIAKFSDPPVPADLEPLVLDEDDYDDLEDCTVADCDMRLTEADILRVTAIDWEAEDAPGRAAALYKAMLFDYLRAYRAGGQSRLPVYMDQDEPLSLGDELAEILSLPSPLDRAPGLVGYLEGYPTVPLPAVEDFFYWSKEAFGFKPVIGLYHLVMHTTAAGEVFIVTTQIYASHYMDGQVSLSVVMPHAGAADEGFYWLYFNRARIGRLDSFMGRLSKSIVQRRTRGGLSRSLTQTQERMEKSIE